ncbi:MAG: type VII secretion protein EssC [Lachnospiraceae bacterium]|nr:type VII secretion protein EssC [Lachnospiraceae bacterium]
MLYNTRVYREFLLPKLYDEDFSITLSRQLYQLKKDVVLQLEKSSAGWELVSGADYQVRFDGMYCKRLFLRDQNMIEVKTRAGDSFFIVVIDIEPNLSVMEKYDIHRLQEIRIGCGEDCLIQYQFFRLISRNHVTLTRQSDGWYLTDTSKNGVFCNQQRIHVRKKLQFGDCLDLFGLHLIFLGNVLAAGAHYGTLSVKEAVLKRLPIEKEETAAAEFPAADEEKYFHRSPRNLPVIYRDQVEIEAPPSPKTIKEKPLYMTIGPAFTMAIPMLLGCSFAIFGSRLSGRTSGAFMYTGLITAFSAAVIGVIWAVLNLNYSRKEGVKEEELRFNAYSNYLIHIADSLREKYRHNSAAMNQMYPSVSKLMSYNERSSELWTRNFTHTDFLYQRVGLGDQPFQIDIRIPKEKFTLINDSLSDKPRLIREEFRTLKQVPVGISLMEKRLIGLVGGKGKRGAIELMHTLAAGIAAQHTYTDVKMVFIYRDEDPDLLEEWECMRWFPHVWSEDKSTRYMASTELETRDIFFELSNIIRARSQDEKKGYVKPHYVIFVSDPSLLEGELLAKYIYEARPELGITTFLMVDAIEDLPNECEEVIENTSHCKAIYSLMNTADTKQAFTPDKAVSGQIAEFGKTLANIRINEVESTSEIPSSLDFFSMYGIHTLEELDVPGRWRRNRSYNSMRALIGKKAGNADCYLDIHEKFHGPHGLVAGTTGSGKSETLQTYILSLAVNFSPEDVSFFIIDFKGGGMANLFSDLPHLGGQISNLSGNQVHRAMISIKSENVRRQRIFSEHGVNNINLYTRLYKNHEAAVPVPHLFIIIDEFAELKREEPDFMKELISVAQVGRSLGVHLILATQKPSGTVDDNIWSNSKFRLCLRVQDRQDSNDMLHKPDAAFITQAGRCYLQVGNDEIYELFQSGYSGAPYEEFTGSSGSAAALLTRTGKAELAGGRKNSLRSGEGSRKPVKEVTQLDAVISYLKDLAKNSSCRQPSKLWLPVLKDTLLLEELDGFSPVFHAMKAGGAAVQQGAEGAAPAFIWDGWKQNRREWKLRALIGLLDDPQNQAQLPLVLDFSESGHLAVCGSAYSGKSTLLQTLVYSLLNSCSPDELQLYLIDYSSHMLSPFEEAPHVGGVVYDTQEDKLDKFFHMLVQLMDARKKLFKGGNYSQYIHVNGMTLPAVMIVIDNLSSLREKTKYQYDDALLRLVREGAGYGIFLVCTAAGFGMNEIPTRIADNIKTVLSLEQADKYKYMEILRTTHLSVVPESNIKGRGLADVDGRILEFQTALSVDAEEDFSRGQTIEAVCRLMKESWTGACAPAIPEIPEHPTLQLLSEDARYQAAIRDPALLPAGYYMQDAEIYSMDLSQSYCFFISGRSRSGKTNALKMFLHGAIAKKAQVCVVEKDTGELSRLCESAEGTYVTDSKGLFRYLSELLPEFAARNKEKQSCVAAGMEEAEIFETMSKKQPVFIFLADVGEFIHMVYNPGEGVGNMSGFVENILEKGSLHNIYFIGCLKVEDETSLTAYKAYQLLIRYKKGLHVGGNLAAQKIFNFQNISFANQSKGAKKGFGIIPDEEEESRGIEVVIPLAKN